VALMIALPNLDRSFTCTLFWTQAEYAGRLAAAARSMARRSAR
jgi:hypothetical protein